MENGILRSGAKYEIIQNIIAHVNGYKKQQKQLEKEKAKEKKENGNNVKQTSLGLTTNCTTTKTKTKANTKKTGPVSKASTSIADFFKKAA